VNFGELKSWVMDFLQATFSDGNWGETEIERYIRDEELRLFTHVVGKDEDFFYVEGTPISEVAGQKLYQLPTNLYKLLRLERIAGLEASPENPITLAVVDHNYSSIQRARSRMLMTSTVRTVFAPMHYQLHGQSQFELMPTPSSALANSLRPVYAARPAGMVDPSDVPFQITTGPGGAGKDDLREYHDIIALGACEKALLHEEAYPQADRVKMSRLERTRELDQYLSQINVQTPRFVHLTDETLWE